MRFDTPIYFQTITPGEYDPVTGDYEPDVVAEEMRRASVTNSGRETLLLVYGEVRQGSLTLCLQNRFTKPFHRIRIGDVIYRVDSTRPLRIKQTFVVSEVQ